MSESWNTVACLGPVPHFHADPTEDGPPLLSADGHWWWDGHAWTRVAEPQGPDAEQPAPALAGTG